MSWGTFFDSLFGGCEEVDISGECQTARGGGDADPVGRQSGDSKAGKTASHDGLAQGESEANDVAVTDGIPQWHWDPFPGQRAPSLIERITSRGKRDSTDDNDNDKQIDDAIDEARERVEHYQSCGQAARHDEYMADARYRGSLEHALAMAVECLERRIDEYDKEMRSANGFLLADETSGRRVLVLHSAIGMAERILCQIRARSPEALRQLESGRIGWAVYDKIMSDLRTREWRTMRQLDMGGLGMTMEDLGDVMDEAGHILEDSQTDDDGEMRKKIAKKIRSMSREMALEVIEHAVADGIISEETARYLVREYVRAR